jgi:hypothetical protein
LIISPAALNLTSAPTSVARRSLKWLCMSDGGTTTNGGAASLSSVWIALETMTSHLILMPSSFRYSDFSRNSLLMKLPKPFPMLRPELLHPVLKTKPNA